MRALFAMGKQSDDEILDLTAPEKTDGIVARWLRESLAFSAPEPAYVLRQVEGRAV
jgi:hypothetical protein